VDAKFFLKCNKNELTVKLNQIFKTIAEHSLMPMSPTRGDYRPTPVKTGAPTNKGKYPTPANSSLLSFPSKSRLTYLASRVFR